MTRPNRRVSVLSDGMAENILHRQIHHLLEKRHYLTRIGVLNDFADEESIAAIADSLAEWWSAIPRRYSFYLPISSFDEFCGRIPVGSRITLLDLPENRWTEELCRLGEPLNGLTRYVRIDGHGLSYFGTSDESALVSATRMAKQFFVLGHVSRVFDIVSSGGSIPEKIDVVDRQLNVVQKYLLLCLAIYL